MARAGKRLYPIFPFRVLSFRIFCSFFSFFLATNIGWRAREGEIHTRHTWDTELLARLESSKVFGPYPKLIWTVLPRDFTLPVFTSFLSREGEEFRFPFTPAQTLPKILKYIFMYVRRWKEVSRKAVYLLHFSYF